MALRISVEPEESRTALLEVSKACQPPEASRYWRLPERSAATLAPEESPLRLTNLTCCPEVPVTVQKMKGEASL